jgi:hypothetical protein
MLRRSFFLAMLVVACGQTPDSEATAQEQTPTESSAPAVELSVEPRLEGRTLHVAGALTAPDGALLSYEVRHANLLNLDLAVSFAEGVAPVSNGRYNASIDLRRWPAGDIEVWVGFQTILATGTSQPDTVISLFGTMGEHMRGTEVRTVAGMRRAEVTRHVQLP